MKLMIVESPNKVQKIASFLGPGWMVEASVGHIRDLPKKDMGIDHETFAMTYELTEKGRSVIQRLKTKAAMAERVVLATDPDREGEAIAWHLQQALKLRDYDRVTFTEITEQAVRDAVQRPRRLNGGLVRAQEARRGLDRILGYTVSPLTPQIIGTAASAGRVQTPAVRLVDDREQEIQRFRVTNHFGAELAFDGGSWSATWDRSRFVSDEHPYVLDRHLAQRAASCRNLRVLTCERKPVFRAPPSPFTTSTLLQAASASLGMSPDRALQTAQKLFEGGHITYHRTDSVNFSEEAIEAIRKYASGNGLPLPAKSRRWASKDAAQEAHEAIRPTHVEDLEAGDDGEQRKLYQLIWRRAVACQLADATFVDTKLVLEGNNEGQLFLFKAQGSVMTAPGWKSLTREDAAAENDDADDADDAGKVPILEVGAQTVAERGSVTELKTRPPQRYTQASLIKKLEALGIGRPSTFASTLSSIMKKGYVREEARQLRPTELGSKLVRGLTGRFSFVEYAFTKDVEDQLDAIVEGTASYRDVLALQHRRLIEELAVLGINYQAATGARPPSESQLALAERLAAGSGLVLSADEKADSRALSDFIERARKAIPQEPATAKQIELLRSAIEKGQLSSPEGWPEITKDQASAMLNTIFGKSKPGGGGQKKNTRSKRR